MARNCCWNCKYYVVRGDHEPAFLSNALSNVCTYSDREDDKRTWMERACPTPPNYVCGRYKERFY